VQARQTSLGTYEDSLDSDDYQDDNRQSQVGHLRSWFTEWFPIISNILNVGDSPSDETEDRSDKQDGTETAKDIRYPPARQKYLLRGGLTYLRKTLGRWGVT
jgi:hypothetical protein